MVSATARQFESSFPPSSITNVADCVKSFRSMIDAMCQMDEELYDLTELQSLHIFLAQWKGKQTTALRRASSTGDAP